MVDSEYLDRSQIRNHKCQNTGRLKPPNNWVE